jgi:hydrogenase expression/formation protein HypE
VTNNETSVLFGQCPVPLLECTEVLLGHGSGGKLTADLIERVFLPAFRNPYLEKLDDQAVVEIGGTRLAFTTDSFVVTPVFFPGGDIGSLAVNGTVNDLAMCGARPLFLSAGFILEEGFPLSDLQRIVGSMREACERASVTLVTGDTKVVHRGSADKIFITTSGVGIIEHAVRLGADQARPGDRIIVSGTIADHGMAVMATRDELEVDTPIESDTAALHGLVQAMLDESADIHCMRDPTRGGLASSLNEIARASKVGMVLEERGIPIKDEVKGLCELLGLEPLYVANEGKLVAMVGRDSAERVLQRMRRHPLGADAEIIGEVTDEHPGMVVMRTGIGGTRIVDVMMGEQLPRIC